MPELCNGNEVCSTCKKPHVAKLDGITCDCPYKVVIAHTDPQEAETAVALKYRQRARVAEEALANYKKQDSMAINLLRDALPHIRCQDNYQSTMITEIGEFLETIKEIK